jgi:hypothetical protein
MKPPKRNRMLIALSLLVLPAAVALADEVVDATAQDLMKFESRLAAQDRSKGLVRAESRANSRAQGLGSSLTAEARRVRLAPAGSAGPGERMADTGSVAKRPGSSDAGAARTSEGAVVAARSERGEAVSLSAAGKESMPGSKEQAPERGKGKSERSQQNHGKNGKSKKKAD